ncbi:MAG TPA: PDZ domain-containing protein [Acidimicrobiales bacterium]|nr:PDZ domain-containing protein [Acidimicrobiales bacterium]
MARQRAIRPYLRHPSIAGDTIAFVAEDDVWVASIGGRARRLTAADGVASFPRFSPDGSQVAFSRQDSCCTEVYVVDTQGGEPIRLTWLGGLAFARGWLPDGRVVFTSDVEQPFRQVYALHAVPAEGGPVEPLRLGPARDIATDSDGTVVVGRNTADPARWKRYRGGQGGRLWVDGRGTGRFKAVLHDLPNVAAPMILEGRVWFLSDHEGTGNLYSARRDGGDLRRHTDHADFYARWASTDGERIVYQCAGDLWLHDPKAGNSAPLDVDVAVAGRRRRSRRAKAADSFTRAARTPTYDLSHDGRRAAVEVRGQVADFGVSRGAVRVTRGAGRRRLPRFLPDGSLLVVGDNSLELDGRVISLSGRPAEVVVSPTGSHAAVATHEHELLLVDLLNGKAESVERSDHGAIGGPSFSPDGAWLSYTTATAGAFIRQLRLREISTGRTGEVGRAEFGDSRPSFDPTGRYLWFLSARGFAPVADEMGFELHFPRPVRPFVVTLRASDPDPFHPDTSHPDTSHPDITAVDPVQIDLDGIEDRVRAVPVPAGRYSQLVAVRGGVVLRSDPIEGQLDFTLVGTDVPAPSEILLVTIGDGASHTLAADVTDFTSSADREHLLIRKGRSLQRLEVGVSPGPPVDLDLDRVTAPVDPRQEWRQIFDEAWELMSRFFWTEDMGGVDWTAIQARWEPMVDRLGSRSDLSDVIWEMYGELGVSHAYEFGGDHDLPHGEPLGSLGADVIWDGRAWSIERLLEGDPWDPDRSSPLRGPGIEVRAGDRMLEVAGQGVGAELSPRAALAGLAGRDVSVRLSRGRRNWDVELTALRDERALRYRDWVIRNRRRVHESTSGRCGYVHVPNMGNPGFAEFHRAFYAELGRDALIVDVRFNEGGYVSTLLLEKLLRRRLGWMEYRWQGAQPYPRQAVSGLIVGLCNEYTGSDGDLFSHAFRMHDIGPLVGTRTWGGVIGIDVKELHADGTLTAQPELAHWFPDVGWDLEGTGAEPTHPVDVQPTDEAAGLDRQLEEALRLVAKDLKRHRPQLATTRRTNRSAPALPPSQAGARSPSPKRRKTL